MHASPIMRQPALMKVAKYVFGSMVMRSYRSPVAGGSGMQYARPSPGGRSGRGGQFGTDCGCTLVGTTRTA